MPRPFDTTPQRHVAPSSSRRGQFRLASKPVYHRLLYREPSQRHALWKMQLCAVCRGFDLHTISRAPDATWARRALEVEKRASEGCALCSFLLEQLESAIATFSQPLRKCWVRLTTTTEPRSDSSLHPGLSLDGLNAYISDSNFATKSERISEKIFLGLAAQRNSAAALNNDVVGRFYGDDPSSTHHTSGVLDWLSSCLCHDACTLTASGAVRLDPFNVRLPTRCIDVMSKHVTLQDTSQITGSYAALSHRWNHETEDCKTTTDNIVPRCNGRGIGRLPRIFDDAITITKSLGIRYLWIDSLCIIQSGDEGRDWTTEASKMAQYYQQAVLTISVPQERTDRSLLEPRQGSAFHSLLRLPYRNRSSKVDGVFYIYRPSRSSPNIYYRDVRRSQLLSRGWVFQEWFLSRRIIHYTPQALFFECQTEFPRDESGRRIIQLAEQDISLRNTFKSPEFDAWYTVLTLYSRTELSRPNRDHIVALAGLADEFREGRKQHTQEVSASATYVAGLWLEDIHYGLLWQLVDRTPKPCSCGASTWSWASRLGEVYWLPRSPRVANVLRVISTNTTSALRAREDAASMNDSATLLSPSCSLILKARLQLLFIGERIETMSGSDQEFGPMKTIANETGVESSDQRSGDWRAISTISNRTVVRGWALFDDARYVDQFRECSGFSSLALHVSTRMKVSDWRQLGASALNMYDIGHDVYDVLFVEPLGEQTYRRLGIGRIMDRQIQKDFDASEMQNLTLR